MTFNIYTVKPDMQLTVIATYSISLNESSSPGQNLSDGNSAMTSVKYTLSVSGEDKAS